MKKRQRTHREKISVYVRARKRHLRLSHIERRGGKCSVCGYNKCIASLAFHHRDPSKKEYGFSKAFKMSTEVLEKELEKCDLVCHNCHSEIHFDEKSYMADVSWFRSVVMVEKEEIPCKQCKQAFQPKYKVSKFCCKDCREQHFRENSVYPWNFVELVGLFGRSEIARRLGVSQRAVAKKYNRMIGASGGIRTRVPTL